MSDNEDTQALIGDGNQNLELMELDDGPYVQSVNKPSNAWNNKCILQLLLLFILLLVAIGFSINVMPPIKSHSEPSNSKSPVHHHTVYKKAAVAAGNQLCSDIGKDVLQDGGNSIDASIATLICEGVVEPHVSGLGGGFILVYFNSTDNSSISIDAQEVSNKDVSKIFIPGQLKGLSYIYENYGGHVSWERLFEPSIKLCEDGFHVSEPLASALQHHQDVITKTSSLCELFCDEDKDDVKKTGDVITNHKLAATLRTISTSGADAFYSGEIYQKMVKDLPNLKLSQFSNYSVHKRPTLQIDLPNAGKQVLTSGIHSGGPVLATVMAIMDSYNIDPHSYSMNHALTWHRIIETFKLAFGHAPYLTTYDDVTSFFTDDSLRNLRDKINSSHVFDFAGYYGTNTTDHSRPDHPSTHVSILAPNGDAVSVTSSIASNLGSRLVSSSTGIMMSSDAGGGSSFLSPCIVTHSNRSYFVIGSSGGKHAPTATSSALLRLLYFGSDDPDDAIKLPLFHNQLFPMTLLHEAGFVENLLEQLESFGHQMELMPASSFTNAIKKHKTHIHAYSDLRNPQSEAEGW